MSAFDPTQETWRSIDEPEGALVLDTNRPIAMFVDENHDLVARPAELAIDHARARLASAAPDMARVLLELDLTYTTCRVCLLRRDGDSDKDHLPNCALDAALRKGGAR